MRQGIDRIGMTRLAAFVAALVFVLQSALAVAAPPVQRDIFGNVICADGSGGHVPGRDHDGGHMPDCCMLSCGAAFQTTAGLPSTVEWPAVTFVDEAVGHRSQTLFLLHERRTPANPRAPPAA